MQSSSPIVNISSTLSLRDLAKRHAKRFFVCALLGMAIGISIGLSKAQQWSASVLIQVGQVGSPSGVLVEPVNVVQRMKFPSFVQNILRERGLPTDVLSDKRSALIKDSLSASLPKGGGSLIQLVVNGYSTEEATQNLNAAFHLLEKEHLSILLPSMTRLNANLDQVTLTIKALEDERSAILRPIDDVKKSSTIEKKFSESILLTSMLKANEAERRALLDKKTALEEQLSPMRTFATKKLTNIYVEKISRHVGLIGISSIFIGLALAMAWVYFFDEDVRRTISGMGEGENMLREHYVQA